MRTPTRFGPAVALFVSVSACATNSARPEAAIGPRAEYRVRLLEPAARAVEVELRLRGLDPGATELALTLPEGYSFVRLEAPLLAVPLAAATPAGTPLALESDGPYRWKLATGGATDAIVTWTSALTAQDRPEVAERDSFGHPYVTTDHALLMTGAILVAPEFDGRAEATYRVRFEGPAHWPVLCSWREVEPGTYDPGSEQALQDDLVALGDWNRRRIQLDGMEIDVGIAPGQASLEALAVPAIEKICSAELALFGMVPRERYLFLFVAPKPVQGFSFAGSPKNGAMVLQVCGDLGNPTASEMIAHLVAHEFHHLWAVSRLDFGDDLRFVGEGFTDWYAHVVPARLGLMTREKLGEKLGEKLDGWKSLAVGLDTSLSQAGGPRFFEGQTHYDATYTGGLLVAALLDLELRRAGRADGLDGWLREFVNDPRWQPRKTGPGVADFLAAVDRTLGTATRERVSTWVEQQGGFDPDAELARLGVAVQREPVARRMRANFEGARIVALDPRSDAGRLGLREGDTLLAVNGRDVADERSIQDAWSEPVEGSVRVRLERGGQRLELSGSIGAASAKSWVNPSAWSGG
ncbi:MAG: hypothetical protein NTY35_14175 [Planctomycetota bacterium]|nr:hypothetical protein [Planctomycetota bacterium]